ncbi:hypothetical protein [Clostridium aciditolerans]|uniref:hypothetical protein n=1 Tax=Clostridium aciditolerans TaxID=339861 RepID=UPI001FEC6E77|nr:hypothetical protein [Clostridium aciditolerans]
MNKSNILDELIDLEGLKAQSRRDFLNKMNIALKEASEKFKNHRGLTIDTA